MKIKKCFKCELEKPITEFYVHKQMKDGHVNKCKECNKNDVKGNYKLKAENFNWIEKERERSKLKYHRLKYKDKQKEWNTSKPWKNNPLYKGLRRKFKSLPKSFELHHWNYNDEFLEDIIILEVFNHRRSHLLLDLDLDKKIFKSKDGTLLDTKEAHIEYLIKNGIKF